MATHSQQNRSKYVMMLCRRVLSRATSWLTFSFLHFLCYNIATSLMYLLSKVCIGRYIQSNDWKVPCYWGWLQGQILYGWLGEYWASNRLPGEAMGLQWLPSALMGWYKSKLNVLRTGIRHYLWFPKAQLLFSDLICLLVSKDQIANQQNGKTNVFTFQLTKDSIALLTLQVNVLPFLFKCRTKTDRRQM